MKPTLSFLLGLARLAAVAHAHTIFTTLYVNDVSQGDGTCVRMSDTPSTCTSPVSSITSDDMACGANGQKAVAFTCPAPAGGKLTFQWRLWADAEQPGVLDKSHKGPCAIYAKQLDSSSSSSSDAGSAAGPGWFKLWDEGYDEAAGLWCTEKLIADDGLLSFRIPAALPPGNWLFRPELLALQNANQGDPQFYVGCAQVFVEGAKAEEGGDETTAAAVMPSSKSVSIPGHVSADDPGLNFNIYSNKPAFPYPIPGPPVFVPSSSSSSSSPAKKTIIKQTEGQVPDDYLIKNANWVGVEVDAYTTQDGCWASAEQCWDQAETCYDAAPPTGNANCRVWEARCTEINDACDAGDYVGPPHGGEKLADDEPEPVPAAEIPAAVNEGQGDGGGDGEDAEDGSSVTTAVASNSQPAPTAPAAVDDSYGEEESPVVVTVTRVVTMRAAAETGVGRRSAYRHRHQFR
ncbi:hypothetical protein MGN70_014129 [Eutypa lata]|nr:hypothetical protein MGN70_014129 [Eutypa lata]